MTNHYYIIYKYINMACAVAAARTRRACVGLSASRRAVFLCFYTVDKWLSHKNALISRFKALWRILAPWGYRHTTPPRKTPYRRFGSFWQLEKYRLFIGYTNFLRGKSGKPWYIRIPKNTPFALYMNRMNIGIYLI